MQNEEIKIAILEQRLVDFITVVEKLENAINKINDVNSNILKMVAVHNEKIEQFYREGRDMERLVREFDEKHDDDISVCMIKIGQIESRIDRMPDLDELSNKVEDVLRVKWMVVGVGSVLVVVIAALTQLSSGVWTKHNHTSSAPIEIVKPSNLARVAK